MFSCSYIAQKPISQPSQHTRVKMNGKPPLYSQRVSAESYASQGIEKEPSIHVGNGITREERQGYNSKRQALEKKSCRAQEV